MLDKRKLDDVLAFINRYTDENGFPPTVRDICAELHIKSTATAYDYVNRLKEMGLLHKATGKKRAVAVKTTNSVRVPLIGTVTAGTPILATENYEGYYTLPSNMFSGDDLFLLTVKGDSMIEAGIFNGDTIVVRKQETADNGDIVVAMFGGEGAVTEDPEKAKKAQRSSASSDATGNLSCTPKTAHSPTMFWTR